MPPLCYDFSNVGVYLARPEVQAALGVDGKHKWKDCNHAVALEFELAGDWMHSFQTKLPEQLAGGIRVLIYAGDQDYICVSGPTPSPRRASYSLGLTHCRARSWRQNWLGNQAWTRAMEWPHKSEFNAAPVADWTVDGAPAGTVQTSNNFTFLRVYGESFPSCTFLTRHHACGLLACLVQPCPARLPQMLVTWYRVISPKLRWRCSTSFWRASSEIIIRLVTLLAAGEGCDRTPHMVPTGTWIRDKQAGDQPRWSCVSASQEAIAQPSPVSLYSDVLVETAEASVVCPASLTVSAQRSR